MHHWTGLELTRPREGRPGRDGRAEAGRKGTRCVSLRRWPIWAPTWRRWVPSATTPWPRPPAGWRRPWRGPCAARLLELFGEVAAELQASEPHLRVEFRLVGDNAELRMVQPEWPPEASEPEPDSDADARITLRLSSPLKARVEAASAREGVSVNTWIVRVLGQQARQPGASRGGRRLTGYGRS